MQLGSTATFPEVPVGSAPDHVSGGLPQLFVQETDRGGAAQTVEPALVLPSNATPSQRWKRGVVPSLWRAGWSHVRGARGVGGEHGGGGLQVWHAPPMSESKRPTGCGRLALTWLASAMAVSFTSWLLPGVHVDAFWPTAFLVALVIGAANAILRPILVLLTLPATILTLGLFLLVINGAMLEVADRMLDSFSVDSLGWAILGSVVLSTVTSGLEGAFGVEKER
jgi:putative membrane protein